MVSHAKEAKARAVYLHVIAYNTAAIALYQRNSFSEVACREKFYYIWSAAGRPLLLAISCPISKLCVDYLLVICAGVVGSLTPNKKSMMPSCTPTASTAASAGAR